MIFLWIYLVCGVLNYGEFLKRSQAPATVGEAAFFMLLWPVQAAFQVFVGFTIFMEWLGSKILP